MKVGLLAVSALLLASCGNASQTQAVARENTWKDDAEAISVYVLNARYDYTTIDEKGKGSPSAWLVKYMVSGDSIHMELEDRLDEANRFYRSYFNCSWTIDYKK